MATYIKPEAIKDSSLPIAKIDNVALDLADKVNALDDNNKALFLNKINAMPATPSGDPMHYAYVAAGAEYNDTGADIVKDTPWADLADDADKTVVHKAGYWYLNGLGDLTTDEIREIYSFIGHTRVPYTTGHGYFSDIKIRTNFYMDFNRSDDTLNGDFLLRMTQIKVVGLGNSVFSGAVQFMYYARETRHVLGEIKITTQDAVSFFRADNLKTIKLKIQNSFSFKSASNLTTKSILYMINNEAATSAITITLHADAYARAMADAEILAALETHTNISLASA